MQKDIFANCNRKEAFKLPNPLNEAESSQRYPVPEFSVAKLSKYIFS